MIDVMENKNAEKVDAQLIEHDSLNTEIERTLNVLTSRQKEVLVYFFGLGIDHPLSLEDIGERYNLTRERVRQIKDKALDRLRETTHSRLLRGYLG
jgi:RNA polymerase primary sigma factor